MSWKPLRICPICGHGDAWCCESEDTGAVNCMRVSSDRPTKNGGWLHTGKNSTRRTWYFGRVISIDLRPGRSDIAEQAEAYQRAARGEVIEEWAAKLGVTATSLYRLHVGNAFDRGDRKANWHMFDAGDLVRMAGGVLSFPMMDATGAVIGIKVRQQDGKKLSVPGGREGLFLPSDLPDEGPLLVTEGPTDTAALLDLGLAVVGRPSCTGGTRLLVDLVTRRRIQEVVVVADGDLPGQYGAGCLASVLRAYCPTVKVITPPVGIKDARAWRIAGATAADVQATINTTSSRGLRINAEVAYV